MTTTLRVDGLGAALSEYAEKARALLEANGRPVNRVVDVAPGLSPAWDDSCSQLYTRVVQLQPVLDQNARNGAPGCGISFYTATVAIAVTRCVATIDDKGRRIKLPSAEEVTADGLAMIDDLVDLETVIRCHRFTRSVVSGQALPEAGGMAGFEWQFTLRLQPCACPVEPPAEG